MLVTTIAGSLPKPAWLATPNMLWAPWQLPPDRLEEGKRDAVLAATAYLSPPVAMSAYYLKQVVPQWSLATIYRGMADFMVIQIIALILVLTFPQIALWFPNWLFGP